MLIKCVRGIEVYEISCLEHQGGGVTHSSLLQSVVEFISCLCSVTRFCSLILFLPCIFLFEVSVFRLQSPVSLLLQSLFRSAILQEEKAS